VVRTGRLPIAQGGAAARTNLLMLMRIPHVAL
jgi:hypothetical protein